MDPQTLFEVMLAIAERTEGDPDTRFAAMEELLKEVDGLNDDTVKKPKIAPSRFEKSLLSYGKAGFTGQKPDNTGRVQCFAGGIHVPCAGKSPVANRRQAGSKPSTAAKHPGAIGAGVSHRTRSEIISSSGGGSVFVSVGRPDHLADQMLARKVYSLFINSDLKAEVKKTKEGPALLVPVPPEAVPLKDDGSPRTLQKIQGSFILDAFLSNWSLVGENFDHILVDPKGKVYRMDMTGCMRFHEDGSKKNPEEFGPEVIEGETFLDPNTHPDLAKVYQGLKPWDPVIQKQIKILLSRSQEVLTIFPQVLKDVMSARLKYLQEKSV